MPEGDSLSSTTDGAENSGDLWQRVKSLLFRREAEPTLREQLEEAISEHEEEAEEEAAVENGDDLSAVERTMLRNLLHFSEHRVDDVMVPRSEMIAVEDNADFGDAIALFSEHGHSRLPVYHESLDNVIGMIHIKDVFAVLAEGKEKPESLEAFVRQPRFVPESMGVLELLDEMRHLCRF